MKILKLILGLIAALMVFVLCFIGDMHLFETSDWS